MSFRIGDAVFGRQGQPGIVVEKDDIQSKLTVDSDKKAIDKNHRHGYINGLKTEQRSQFLEVMDTVAETKDPHEKMETLQKKIGEARADPKQFHLVSYLESELFHVMNQYQISPRTYKIQFHG